MEAHFFGVLFWNPTAIYAGASNLFSKAIDSQFQHLGRKALYKDAISKRPIRVFARRPEQLFSLGEEKIHGEKSQIEFRLSEVSSPSRGDEIDINGRIYRIEEEPRLDLHQLVWSTDANAIA